MVIWVAMSSAPTGFIKANGAAVSRTTYSALFAAIGTTFGSGDGSTTFNVPDLRGEFVRGWDDSRGVDSGRSFGSAQAEMIGPHNHTVNDPGHSHSLNYTPIKDGGGIVAGRDGSPHYMGTGGGINSNTTGISINNNSGTETRPRNVALLACIKT
jgi:phage-related tail fiber protein